MSEKIYFYKYKSLKSVDDLKFLEDSLQQKVWFPSLVSLNDPFEGACKIRHDADFTLKNEALFKCCYQAQKERQPESTEEDYRKFLQSPEFRKAQLDNEYLNGDLFKDWSSFCLTTDYFNIPMWAHYGDEHRGYCLIFELDFSIVFKGMDIKQDNESQLYLQEVLNGDKVISFHFTLEGGEGFKFCFGKVKYENKPKTILFNDFITSKSKYEQMEYVFKNIIGIKYYQWEYEQEYRLIANQNSRDSDSILVNLGVYAPFLKVCGVIMGKNLSVKNPIIDLCNRYCIDLYQAETSKVEYDIDVNKVLDFGKTPKELPKKLY